MRKILILLLFIALTEVWILQPTTKIEYWQGLKQADSSLAITPQILILRRNFEEIRDGQDIATMPLGSRSHANIVFCEESDGMIEYRSDRFGFRNPDAAWDKPVDLAIVGDSFAQGACVPAGDDFASQLRQQSGNVLNLGSLGNGPLGNLAVVSEYLKDVKPKKLLWFYVANDLTTDLTIEEQTPLIAGYRDPSFTQALRLRQKDLDDLIGRFLQEEAAAEAESSQWLSWLKLTNIQNALTRTLVKVWRLDSWRQARDMDYARPDALNFEALAEAVQTARHILPETEFAFVIIPDAGMHSEEFKEAVNQHIARLKQTMEEINVPAIDLRRAFEGVESPLRYYAVKDDGTYGHFTPEGYRMVATYLKSQMAP